MGVVVALGLVCTYHIAHRCVFSAGRPHDRARSPALTDIFLFPFFFFFLTTPRHASCCPRSVFSASLKIVFLPSLPVPFVFSSCCPLLSRPIAFVFGRPTYILAKLP